MSHATDSEAEPTNGDEGNQLKASAPGFSITVRGSMLVILVALLIGDAALNLWVMTQLDVHLIKQDTSYDEQHRESVALKSAISEEHRTGLEEVRLNRTYMREIEKLCMLTPEQRLQMQKNLSPLMRELLFEKRELSK